MEEKFLTEYDLPVSVSTRRYAELDPMGAPTGKTLRSIVVALGNEGHDLPVGDAFRLALAILKAVGGEPT